MSKPEEVDPRTIALQDDNVVLSDEPIEALARFLVHTATEEDPQGLNSVGSDKP